MLCGTIVRSNVDACMLKLWWSHVRHRKGFIQSALAGRLIEFWPVVDQERPLSSWLLKRGYTRTRQTCWSAVFALVWTILLYFLWVGSWFPVLRLRTDLGKSKGRRSLLRSSNSRFCVCSAARSTSPRASIQPRTGSKLGSLRGATGVGLEELAEPALLWLGRTLQASSIQLLWVATGLRWGTHVALLNPNQEWRRFP